MSLVLRRLLFCVVFCWLLLAGKGTMAQTALPSLSDPAISPDGRRLRLCRVGTYGREAKIPDAAEGGSETCVADVVGRRQDAFLHERCDGRGEYLGSAGGLARVGEGADSLQGRACVVAE
jgi:hypothetical protein